MLNLTEHWDREITETIFKVTYINVTYGDSLVSQRI